MSKIKELMNYITKENYSYCHFKLNDLRSIISIGADMVQNKIDFIYFVTTLDRLDQEKFQLTFDTIDDALESINDRFKDWEFVNLLENKSGCDSCGKH